MTPDDAQVRETLEGIDRVIRDTVENARVEADWTVDDSMRWIPTDGEPTTQPRSDELKGLQVAAHVSWGIRFGGPTRRDGQPTPRRSVVRYTIDNYYDGVALPDATRRELILEWMERLIPRAAAGDRWAREDLQQALDQWDRQNAAGTEYSRPQPQPERPIAGAAEDHIQSARIPECEFLGDEAHAGLNMHNPASAADTIAAPGWQLLELPGEHEIREARRQQQRAEAEEQDHQWESERDRHRRFRAMYSRWFGTGS
jgi:hypothetical protein